MILGIFLCSNLSMSGLREEFKMKYGNNYKMKMEIIVQPLTDENMNKKATGYIDDEKL